MTRTSKHTVLHSQVFALDITTLLLYEADWTELSDCLAASHT